MSINFQFAQVTSCKADGKQINVYAKACKGNKEFILKLPDNHDPEWIKYGCPRDHYMIAKYVDEYCEKGSNKCTCLIWKK